MTEIHIIDTNDIIDNACSLLQPLKQIRKKAKKLKKVSYVSNFDINEFNYNVFHYSESVREKYRKAIQTRCEDKSLDEKDVRLRAQYTYDIISGGAVIYINNRPILRRNTVKVALHKFVLNKFTVDISERLFLFFSKLCGIGASHYDKFEWAKEYPTIQHVRDAFFENDFGMPVFDWIPKERGDIRRIIIMTEWWLRLYGQFRHTLKYKL